jgi:hypothetical protein
MNTITANQFLNPQEFEIKENPDSLSGILLKSYSSMVNWYLNNLKTTQYSPKVFTQNEAEKMYKMSLLGERTFTNLSIKFDEIKHHSPILFQIHNDFLGIVDEFKRAQEYLGKLKDPKIHSAILETVNRLQTSIFLK